MHGLMLLIVIGLGWVVRQRWAAQEGHWSERWSTTLGTFLFPPLLLLTTALAMLCMGPRGQMVQWWDGWVSYVVAISFLGVAIAWVIQLAMAALRSHHQVHQYPAVCIQGRPGRLVADATPYVAQVGFWHPNLVMSQGLLDTLDAAHLEAALVHEQAHQHYRDTFWFFWLGWLRRLTAWLPQSDALWQELLMLRELRADQWAAQQIDHLLLAEALFSVVSAPHQHPELSASLSSSVIGHRLTERIEALLDTTEPLPPPSPHRWLWLLSALLPLLVIPFHG